MYEVLHRKISELIDISDAEYEFCKSQFQPKRLRKRQYLLQEGDVCKYTAFIEKGIMRSYTIDEKGNEHILQFGLPGWWMGDLYSFFTHKPSVFTMDAIEDCELLLISQPSWDLLLERVPKFERYFRILIQNNLIATQGRLMGNLSLTAEEQYENLMASFPDELHRVPQHMIASYLGITRETLSRIRRNIATRK